MPAAGRISEVGIESLTRYRYLAGNGARHFARTRNGFRASTQEAETLATAHAH